MRDCGESVQAERDGAKSMKCPKCGRTAVKVKWEPPEGMDKRLVQYKCLSGHIFYRTERKRAENKKR